MRNVILMVLLGSAAVASWFYGRTEPVAAPRRARGDDTPLGYFLRGARLIGTDETGHVAYRILADRLEEQQERLLLEGVQVEYHPANEVPWHITAGSGSTPKDGSQLDLSGGVELRSEPTNGGMPWRITTESLRFEPSTSTAASNERTQLRIGDWQLQGNALRAYLKEQRLQLESDVHGKFAR